MKETAVLQIRINPKLKKQSTVVADKLGFTTSTLIKLFLAHVVQTRKIPFVIEEIPNAKTTREMRQAEKDYKAGKYYSFEDMDEAINFLKKSIKSYNARKARTRLQTQAHPPPPRRSRKSVSGLARVQT